MVNPDNKLPVAENNNEKVAFTNLRLTIIASRSISGSSTAKKKAVKKATSSSSVIP